MKIENEKILFFDGVCNLCNGFMDFLIQRDSKRQFKYASLQGEAAEKLLKGVPERENLDSVVFYEDGEISHRSRAVLKVLTLMGFPWNIFAIFRVIPSFISDIVYNLIARNRYKMFGKKDSCRLPLPEEQEYFLD